MTVAVEVPCSFVRAIPHPVGIVAKEDAMYLVIGAYGFDFLDLLHGGKEVSQIRLVVGVVVMVAQHPMLLAGEVTNDFGHTTGLIHAEIAQQEDAVFWIDLRSPFGLDRLVHLMSIGIGPIAIFDDVGVTEMEVTGEDVFGFHFVLVEDEREPLLLLLDLEPEDDELELLLPEVDLGAVVDFGAVVDLGCVAVGLVGADGADGATGRVGADGRLGREMFDGGIVRGG